MRAFILIVVLIVLIAAVVFTLTTLTKGPLAFAGGRTVALADYHAADPTGVPQNLANADQVKRGDISRGRPIAWFATPRRAAPTMPAAWRFRCRSGRSTQPTSRPTKTRASAATATGIFSMPCAAASGATAAVFIRRCRTRPILT
jgi:hypothetical protein